MSQESPRKASSMSVMAPADLYALQVREISEYAMFMLDPEGFLCSWNSGVENLFGYREDEWIGQHACIVFTPEETALQVCQSEMRKAQEQGSATDIRWHRHKNGSQFFANGFMNAVYDKQGEHIGYVKIMSDETARKQLQDSLTESNAALEQFALVASHDLQEPLRTMSSFAELLSERYQGRLDAEADQFLKFITSGAQRMSTLVKDLLTFARITTEEDRPSSVALDEDLEAALTHLATAIEESGAVVTHDPLPMLPVDRGQVVRLFQNLVSNAVKYRKPEVRPAVHVSAEQKGSEWIFSVRDNGIGFEQKYSSVIFEPFKRLHNSQTYSGTGVGLAICSRIVKAHGGRIWAESQPGVGTTFFFSLPVHGQPLQKHTPPVDR